MNRRNAIGGIMALSIGALVMPACRQYTAEELKFKNFSLTGAEVKLMEQLGESIIPKTDFIVVSEMKAHEFALKMVDDCYDPDQQERFVAGLKAFDEMAKSKFGSAFTSLSNLQKNELLGILEIKNDMPGDVNYFYETTKKHTVQWFTTTKEYMISVLKYNMVPGSSFKGCVPIKKGLN